MHSTLTQTARSWAPLPLTLVLLFVAGDAAPLRAQQTRDDTLRVLTYNLHGLLDDASNPDWDPARIAWLADAIVKLNPDIVGFQEVLQYANSNGSDNQILTLAKTLSRRTGKHWRARIAMTHPAWGRFNEGVAILTQHPILSSNEFLLKAKDQFQRNLLRARVRTRIGDVDFFTTHLAYKANADSIREAQVAEIKRDVGWRGPAKAPAILVGDFNARPDRSPIRLATTVDSTGRFIDAFATVHPNLKGYTHPSDGPDRRIDYVFFSEGAPIAPADADVVFGGVRDDKYLSDHLGVCVEFVPTTP